MSSTEPRTVLVVEDNKQTRIPLTATLEAAGYRVLFASNMQAARTYLTSQPDFRAVVIDVYLPDGNGLDLVQEALAQHPTLKVLVISGDHSESIAAAARSLGAEAVLHKPLNYANLIRTLG